MTRLNLGILAHVDAGKTTLTEGLLHAAGVIDVVGRVDDGTTQTDTMALERARGITIRSAVVSFVVDGVTINLLDTPGHPDFVAEVERVLGVLDGAVLVVSAVEGVQPQTVVLFRALRRLGVPTVAFLNKIDRTGADPDRVLAAMTERLGVRVVPLGGPRRVGSTDAVVSAPSWADPSELRAIGEVLAAADEAILRSYVDDLAIEPTVVRRALADQTARGDVVPVFFGSALHGVGVDDLLHALPSLLPAATGDPDGSPAGRVFTIERGADGAKLAVVRMFTGTLRTRDRVSLDAGRDRCATVTAIDVFEGGRRVRRATTSAGEIAVLHGLTDARIGDGFGPVVRPAATVTFAAPTLETAIVARSGTDQRAVFDALSRLAEHDPLINLRQDDQRGELFLSLYGEVQKEVVAQTLLDEHGLEIEFRPTTPVCIERPRGCGRAVEPIRSGRSPHHPFLATVGLAVEPRPVGHGVTFELAVGVGSIPIHVFGSVELFAGFMHRTVTSTLREGLHGWAVDDLHVTMTDSGYQAPPRKWPGTTSWDYRVLTPLVLMAALREAGTVVCEPVLAFRLELPCDDLGPVLAALGELGGHPGTPSSVGGGYVLEGVIRAARVHHLQRRLPDLTHGEGVLSTTPAGYRPVIGAPPGRPRTDGDPLDRAAYLRHLGHRPGAADRV